MKKYYFIILTCLFVFPFQVHAAMCGNDEQVKYAEIANNITYYLDVIEENNSASFQVTFNNFANLRIVDANTSRQYTSNPTTISGLIPNKTYRFFVQPTTGLCSKENVRTIYITVPGYNPYYKDDICKGIESYNLCQRFNQVSITYDEFVQQVTKYKDSLIINEENPTEKKEIKGFYDYIGEFFADYYYIILPIVIVGGIVLIFWLRKKEELF